MKPILRLARRHARHPLGLALLTLGLVSFLAPRVRAGEKPAGGRVVVLGFDGADARRVESMIGEGRLPNLKALADRGTFSPLISTNPAESAAGWAALNTGVNPLKNNVPSFIKRSPSGTPMVDFGHIRSEDVPIDELELPGLLGIYQHYGAEKIAVAIAVAALLFFFILFRFVLKARALLAGLLSLLIAAAGGYAALQPAGSLPDSVPGVTRNNVRKDGFWDYAARAGKRAIVLDGALAFDRPTTPGARVLGGLGLPDVRGAGNGNWFLYTTDDMAMDRPPAGSAIGKTGTGTINRVEERDGKIKTKVYGPQNFIERARLQDELAGVKQKLSTKGLGWEEGSKLRDKQRELEKEIESFEREPWSHRAALDMTIERRGERLAITIAGKTLEAGEGEWTGWFELPFDLGNHVTAGGITRVRVMSLDDPLEIYLHTFDIDPENPPFWQPVSSPPEFSGELASWIQDKYETLGWSCMTNQIKDEGVPVDVFLEDIEFTMGWRKKLAYTCLERDDWDVLFAVFSTTDRVQHMMYRYSDPQHPKYDAEEAEREVNFFGKPTKLKDVIPAIYEQMDKIVGDVMGKLGPNDRLFLCADHGFTSFRRGLEVNNWLAQEGYLVYETPTRTGGIPIVQSYVDWSKTRAYSLGLGMIFVNMQGREPNGIVPRAEAKALLKEIGDKLLTVTDAGPEDAPFDEPHRVVRDYTIMDDVYSGGDLEWGDPAWPCADMQIGLEEFYRVSWSAVSGNMRFIKDDDGKIVPGPIIRKNTSNWSGDHASNSPRLVTGIFFSNRPVVVPEDGVSVMDLAPTILDLLGVPIPEEMDRPALTFR